METELNIGLGFSALSDEQQGSFLPSPVPVLVRFETGKCVYKWTEFPLVNPRKGTISEYWFPWESIKIGLQEIGGFKEFRIRHRNVGGGVGRPQEAARSLAAVTEQWNGMGSILKAQFLKPVWGFLGRTRWQRKFKDPEHPVELENVFFIGGAYQVVIPRLSSEWIKQV